MSTTSFFRVFHPMLMTSRLFFTVPPDLFEDSKSLGIHTGGGQYFAHYQFPRGNQPAVRDFLPLLGLGEDEVKSTLLLLPIRSE